MTSRELLRAVADELLHEDGWPQGGLAAHAAALRALADRFDAEEARNDATDYDDHPGPQMVSDVLERLDAPHHDL